MSIIEQATRRLEELKRAGVEVAWEPAPSSATPSATISPVDLADDEPGYSLDPLDDEDAVAPGAAH